MTRADLRTLTDALVAARRDPTQPTPLVLASALQDADEAYAVQAATAAALGWFDSTTGNGAPRHWKSGGPSRSAVLTHAALPPAGVWASPADATRWPWRLRGIEAEVALRLGDDVDRGRAASLDVEQARALVDAMGVAIEIVDSRWATGLDAPPLAKLADLQLHGALVLGDWLPFDTQRDWSNQRCEVQIGDQRHAFQGTHSLADPAFVLPAWLRHATRDGQVVRAGSVVTTGTWCGILQAKAGDLVSARFDGLGQVRVQV
jgi:2-keto-4-pentenoate hydratase